MPQFIHHLTGAGVADGLSGWHLQLAFFIDTSSIQFVGVDDVMVRPTIVPMTPLRCVYSRNAPYSLFPLSFLLLSVTPLKGLSLVPSPLGFMNPFIDDNVHFDSSGQLLATPASQNQIVPGWLLNRNERGGFFPSSTIAYYRSIKTLLQRRNKIGPNRVEDAEEGHRPNGRDMAEWVKVFNVRAQKGRDRRSEGEAIKRYTCRFKFCRIFSPTDE